MAAEASAPDPALQRAFEGTSYGTADRRFRLAKRPGPAVAFLPPGRSWVIVTAWNPGGRPAEALANREGDAALRVCLERAGFVPLSALNGEGTWQEPAWLVFGASLGQARRWGVAFGQAAVLFGVGRRAALVWRGGAVQRYWALQ